MAAGRVIEELGIGTPVRRGSHIPDIPQILPVSCQL
jgi:hypothetical protein